LMAAQVAYRKQTLRERCGSVQEIADLYLLGADTMKIQTRIEAISGLAALIGGLSFGHPTRVAVDGRTASGKTTVADQIGEALRTLGRDVIRTSIDGFHRPQAERYARGRYSAEGYYCDARDLPAVRALLLDPLGLNGNLQYRTASFDVERDLPLDLPPIGARPDSILIVDGTFLQRPELAAAWEVVLFVDVPEELAAARGAARDQTRLGGMQAAEALYTRRYRPAFAIYDRLCAPRERAHIVFDNRDFDHPTVRVQRTPECRSS
jgi:uridine kinase